MAYVHRLRRTSGPVVATTSFTGILESIVWTVTGIIEAILALRFLLSLLGANPNNSFASLVYDISHPFVAPFFNLFNYNVVNYGVSRFEVFTLVAMAVYAIVAWILSEILSIPDRTVDY